MKVITKAVFQMTEKIGEYILLEEHFFLHNGEIAKCDRGAKSQAQSADTTATNTAANENSNATAELGQVQPFFQSEMKAQHGYTPGQTDELLTAAGAGTGGATGALTGQAQLEQARTRNASGFTKSLDEMARDKDKSLAGASEQVAAQDVGLAKQENQQGAAGEAGLYGTNTGAMLSAMGQESNDVNAEVNADKTGWVQNMDETIKALGSGASGAGAMGVKV